MTGRCIFSIFLFWFCITGVFGQENYIQGTIRTDDHNVIQGATVIVRLSSDSSAILGYAVTNSEGKYHLNFSSNPFPTKVKLTFSALGYKNEIIEREVLENVNIDVVLFAKATVIDEVVVQQRAPGFREKGDTTKYNISSYIDSTERNLEDLLTKLPGIDVTDKGVVSFKGKRIEKILIGGDDFFSSNYTMLTKNIAVDLIKGIEAIENYDESIVLKDLRSSDKVILNVNLKNNRLSKPMGTLELSAGNKQKYSINSSLFSLADKMKIGFFLNKNSIGEKGISDISSEDDGNGQNLPFSFDLPEYFELPERVYIDNNDLLTAAQINYNWKPTYRVSYSVTFDNGKRNVRNSEKIWYRFPDEESNLEFSNSNNNKLFNKSITNSISLKMGFKNKAELLYDGNYVFSKADRLYHLERLDLDRLILQTNTNKENSTTHLLNYNYKLNSKNALSLIYNYKYSNIPFQMTSMNESVSGTEESNYPSYFSGHQTFKYSNGSSDIQLKFYGVSNYLKYETGLLGLISNSHLQNRFPNEETEFQVNNKYIGGFISIARDIHKGELGARGMVKREFVDIKTIDDSKSFLFIEPKFWFHYNISRIVRLSLDYETSNQVSQIFQLYPNDIFLDYFNVQRGNNTAHHVRTQNVAVRLRYANQDKQLMSTFSSIVNISDNPHLNRVTVLKDQLLLNERYISDISSYYIRNQLQTDYYFAFIRSNVRATLRHSSILLASMLSESDVQKNRMDNIYGGAKINTAFLEKPINFILEWGKTWSHLNGIEPAYAKTSSQKIALTGILKLPYKSMFILSADNYYRKNYSGTMNTTFMDARFTFPLKKLDAKVTIWGRNLLNAGDISSVYNSNYIFSENIFWLNKPYFLLSFQFNLIN